jgi:hypothetical protein
MAHDAEKPIGIFYEHPTRLRILFEELETRRIPFVRIQATRHTYNPNESASPYSLVIHGISSSDCQRGNSSSIFHAANYLAHLERLGVPVINGTSAHVIESSKARQLSLLTALGIAYPQTKIVSDASQIVPAARTLRFPVSVKANISGNASVVTRFNSWEALQKAVDLYQVNLGADHTALVQEYLSPAGNYIVRLHILDGKFLYAAKVYTSPIDFEYSPADVCRKPNRYAQPELYGAPETIENDYTPPGQLIEQAERIIQAAAIDIGTVEFLLDTRTDKWYCCDVSARINFDCSSDSAPCKQFADYIEFRLQKLYQAQPVYIL